MRAESLHVGLNAVNPSAYQGWDGRLVACEADARDMRAIAKQRTFRSSRVLLTRRATAGAVSGAIGAAAKRLERGDLFLLTYSGHGGQVPDTNGHEPDAQDETWCLWDRMLVDDELYGLLSEFRAGVRVLVLSDSCHSGTVTRGLQAARRSRAGRFRMIPPEINARSYQSRREAYDIVQNSTRPRAAASVRASVILISGCQDNQYSEDGDQNGLFTGTLLAVWARGGFEGTHRAFRNQIAARMPPWQTPNYYVVGRKLASFERQTPFTP